MKKDIKIEEKMIFLGVTIILLLPSIYYLIRGNGIFNLVSSFSFFYLPTETVIQKAIGAGLFFCIFLLLFIFYLKIIKNENKLFKTNQAMAGFIIVIAILFTSILPMTSTDIFYYIGTGWSEAKYKVNPYYTSVEEVIQNVEEANQDEILLKTPKIWRDSTVVYGPLWTMLCKILSGLSFGSLPIALAIYKIFNLVIHFISCYVIYKITKKKKMVLLYAINPLVLFTGLTEGHNDVLVVGIMILALYFIKKKKKMALTVILVAIATAIKYYAILLIPFLVLYHYRKENIGKRILYATSWGILFVVVLATSYLIYMKDGIVLEGIQRQQEKFANTFLVELALSDYKKAVNLSRILVGIYIIIYMATILKLLWSKKLRFTKNMRIYNNLLLLFIFVAITNFQAWYIMWIFSTMMWQKGTRIKFLLNISIAVELANTVYFARSESVIYAKYYGLAMVTMIILLQLINYQKRRKKCKTIQNQIRQ